MDDDQAQSFADKLNKLFVTFRDEQGREYSPEYVAEWLRANAGPAISTSYLYMLRRGQRDNPTKTHIEAVARFFGISPAYFFDAEYSQRVDEQLELLAAMQDSDVRDIALRSASLHGEARRSVADILRSMAPWASRGRTSTDGDAAEHADLDTSSGESAEKERGAADKARGPHGDEERNLNVEQRSGDSEAKDRSDDLAPGDQH